MEQRSICLINDSFPPVTDGVANAVVNYAKNLTQDGKRATVVTPAYPDADDTQFGFPVVRYPSVDLTKLVGYHAGLPFSSQTLEKLVELMHTSPMRRFGCGTEIAVGQVADLTVFDLNETYTVDPETFLTMGRATPFAGTCLTGACKLTMIGGEIVWKEDML